MSELINIIEYPVRDVLKILLKDKTTKKNIIWATDAYAQRVPSYLAKSQITEDALLGIDSIKLQPRIEKAQAEQQERTRKKAEVFTPAWLCNRMNNDCDEQWFGHRDVFNVECSNHQWDVIEAKIQFPQGKTWQKYVDSRRLEITCGEAPYLVSRYDAASGEPILPLRRRIGILDRKLRIVGENTDTEVEWCKWATRAVQASYGYEYQGDSLLIARINLLMTFCEYYRENWKKDVEKKLLKSIANIISWNLWQMDGLKDAVPFEASLLCKIFNWRSKESLLFRTCKEK